MKYAQALHTTVYYQNPMNREEVFRCTVFLVIPVGSCLQEVWPPHIPYHGLTHRLKRSLGKRLYQPHYVLRHERVDAAGNPRVPRYFVLQETRFETWVKGRGQ